VSIDHDFQPRVGPWATLIERFFVRPIAGRTLATFKAIAEAVATADDGSIPGRSNDVSENDTMESPRRAPR
jgi:hypothetical protein